MQYRSLLSLACLGTVALAACSSSSSGTQVVPSTNGVDDVKKACDIRSTWANAHTSACTGCTSLVTTPRCSCASNDYEGACSNQQAGVTNEPTCTGIDECVNKCGSDCTCVDGCYAGKDACRTRAAALDGCIADVCDPHCR